VQAAVTAAEARPTPGPETLFDDVYMNPTPQLKEQRAELLELLQQGGVGAEVGHFPL
jgi:TPP-dependent pyruvate/acetoin dehydrogenase alpha subunit